MLQEGDRVLTQGHQEGASSSETCKAVYGQSHRKRSEETESLSGRAFENILNMRRLKRALTKTIKKHRLNMFTLKFVLRMTPCMMSNDDRKVYGSFATIVVGYAVTYSVPVSVRLLPHARGVHDHYHLPEHSHSHYQRLLSATSMVFSPEDVCWITCVLRDSCGIVSPMMVIILRSPESKFLFGQISKCVECLL